MNTALAKCSKLSSLVHTSGKVKTALEKVTTRGIPAAVVTRWNSTFRQVQAILSIGMANVNLVVDEANKDRFKMAKFLAREFEQLSELQGVLQPFAEATDVTQGEKVRLVIISWDP